MKKITAVILLILAVTACKTTSGLPASERDGSSFERAIIVNSVPEEYQYARENCEDCQFVGQSLVYERKKPYDILEFKTQTGETIKYYFDISKFFGKDF
ncbi:hypothetical protein ACE01N_15905 [Saccharicrinis sp. FJH2]|uniref:hypothetical protein n=1 Tax=Saccharicrinis sp. FJH65 TaxID=3344659 RepID=UPI0035F33EF5